MSSSTSKPKKSGRTSVRLRIATPTERIRVLEQELRNANERVRIIDADRANADQRRWLWRRVFEAIVDANSAERNIPPSSGSACAVTPYSDTKRI